MSYIDKYTKLGMLSSNYTFDDEFIYKNKDRTKIISFDNKLHPEFKEVNYSYIYEKPNDVKPYKLYEIKSIFHENYFNDLRNYNKDLFQVVRKFDKQNIIISDVLYNKEDVIKLIDKWTEERGRAKYRFNLHSGYDKNFFNKYYDIYKNDLQCLFFYCNNELIGYSICEKDYSESNIYNYIIRKVDTNFGRSICQYVDYKTFENLFSKNKETFRINWGCSSGGVMKYKTKNFPLDSLTPCYFWKVNNEI